ncbi:thioredoxin-dependent thiol peroxidase [uncultured Propionibacterium sp.]|uniref:thioredoxin-dependent thiol peroxidase n=1 Tax=uncultured Propionibacterium sp. TaxID=218066 RepID=UPI00293067FC|nr:thioredoxin-dependent thiol peroxidase [uncultured Propionibacterium sp.]
MTQLTDGDRAPAFALPDADGRTVSLSDHSSRTVVVYFYPAALTPGCTTQAIDFTGHVDAFTEAGVDIVGISPDTRDKLMEFREKKSLRVTLLSDPGHEAIEAYGVWGERTIYGKKIVGLVRSTFIIDVDAGGSGTVRRAMYNVRAAGHAERIARELGIG